MRILNFGSLNLDYVYQVPRFPAPGETIAVREQAINAGGKGLNQSIAMARAGAKVCHAGTVGNGSELLTSLLLENGIDAAYLRRKDCIQGNAIIQVAPSGENCILFYGGSNRAVTPEQVEETLSHFSAGDLLVLQNEISCMPLIIEKAAQRGMRIVLNPSPFDGSLRYEKIEWLFINEVEGRQITGANEPDAILAALRQSWPRLNVVLTLGAEGSICVTPTETIRQPIFHVNAVDTTGAGDTFTGYFVAALTAGKPLAECMRRAAAASALSVSRAGASASIPLAQEVDQLLARCE